MSGRGRRSPARDLRKAGARLHHGPWTVYASPRRAEAATVIVAMGKTAGPAVTRSRIRRIARTVFGESAAPSLDGSVLLTARASVCEMPRRRMRAEFLKLKDRIVRVLAHPPDNA